MHGEAADARQHEAGGERGGEARVGGEGEGEEGEEGEDDDEMLVDAPIGLSGADGNGDSTAADGDALDDEDDDVDTSVCVLCGGTEPPNCRHLSHEWAHCSECVAVAHAVCIRRLPGGRIRPREWACADCR